MSAEAALVVFVYVVAFGLAFLTGSFLLVFAFVGVVATFVFALDLLLNP